MCIHIYTHIYIYIYREREREKVSASEFVMGCLRLQGGAKSGDLIMSLVYPY